MSAPFVARALLAAATPSSEYESISGDLHEEYEQRRRSEGASRADLWYWSQAVRSIPSLLSYSRQTPSRRLWLSTASIVLGVLAAMLLGKDALDRIIDVVRPDVALPAWLYFILNWMIAAVFGMLLAQVRRHHPVRLALLASVGFVIAFAIPIVSGLSAQLSLPAWLLLIGTVPAMSAGAATIQTTRNR